MRHNRALIVMAIGLSLSACATFGNKPSIPAQIDPSCFVSVKDTVRWTGDPKDPATWDILGGQVVSAIRAEVAEADAHRLACEQGLRRLHKAKVIDLGR